MFNPAEIKTTKDIIRSLWPKVVVFGGPGTAKTWSITTAPNAILCATELGLMTLSKMNIPLYEAYSSQRFEDFVTWGVSSACKYDTLVIDSISQAAEKKVEDELGVGSKGGNKAHGQAAYGEMSRWVMTQLNKLYFCQNKCIILIAKMQAFEINGGVYRRPYLPGKELPTKVPHLFDFVIETGRFNIPGVVPAPTLAFKCHETFDGMARDRSGNLAMYEPMNFTALFKKALA